MSEACEAAERHLAFEIRHGDAVEVLRTLPAGHFDACLTDPPYGLSFMGKGWDHGVPGVETWREVCRVLKPGAMLLAFGGTRTHHRLMCAIEDAGFEVRDCLMYLYGSGFPKSLDIGKALDKAAGAEREVVGKSAHSAKRNSIPMGVGGNYAIHGKPVTAKQAENWREVGERFVSAPATDSAKTWDGWGTALKPAWEPIILAMKPCDSGPWIIELTPELVMQWEEKRRGHG